MKKGIGCLVLILVLVLLTIIRSKTDHTGGAGGFITFIIFGVAFLGWKLMSSKKTTSSNDKSPDDRQSQTSKVYNTIGNDIVKKEKTQSTSPKPNINPDNTNIEVPKEKKQSSRS